MKAWVAMACYALFTAAFGDCAQTAPRIVAHRGGEEAGHENCVSAFRASLDAGITGFELDARLTKDGELVVLHDGELKRCVPGETRRAEDVTAAEFKSFTFKGTDEHLPTLREVLSLFKGRKDVWIEIEMKSNYPDFYRGARLAEYCRKLRELTAELLEPGTYVFPSFYGSALDEMHRQDPNAPTTYIIYKDFTEKDIDEAVRHHAKRLSVKLSADGRTLEPSFNDLEKARRLCDLARAKGVDIVLWMVASPELYRLAAKFGAISVTVNAPKRLQRELSQTSPASSS